MTIFNSIDEVDITGSVATIGLFDGFHLGHRKLIRRVVSVAKKRKLPSLAITFWPHPRMLGDMGTHPLRLLSTLEEKYQLLNYEGLDAVLVIQFSPVFAKVSAKNFVDKYLVEKLGISHVVVGHNHVFGHGGKGNFLLLEKYVQRGIFTAEKLPPHKVDGLEVSSTKIRNALEVGNVALANRMLGHLYSLSGTIEGGQRLGRSIGFPTANIRPVDCNKLIPAHGVYAVWIVLNEKSYPAMMSIGVRPTLGDGLDETIEAHIIGFEQDIYDKDITILFHDRIRDELKFPSLNHLRRELERDREKTLSILGISD